jgi:Domain of unknown function (DUF1707)
VVPGDPRIRASDADRDRIAALLREHHAAGRLTSAEFNDRLDRAMDATTLGELDELMADLPAIDLYELPDAALRRARGRGGGEVSRLDSGSGVPGVPGLPWGSLVARDQGAGGVPELPAWTVALVAWGTVAATLIVIAVVTGILVGALSAWWVLGAIPAGALTLIWLVIRRSQR